MRDRERQVADRTRDRNGLWQLSRDIMRLFEQFHEVGTTVIIASHERELIASIGKPIVELSHGQIASPAPSDGHAAAQSH